MVKSILSSIGLLAIAGGIGTAAYFFGGFFSVAADHADPTSVNWALVDAAKASIARRAPEGPPESLEDAAIVQVGTLAFATSGCAYCHGEPGVESEIFSSGLDPPADLRTVITAR